MFSRVAVYWRTPGNRGIINLEAGRVDFCAAIVGFGVQAGRTGALEPICVQMVLAFDSAGSNVDVRDADFLVLLNVTDGSKTECERGQVEAPSGVWATASIYSTCAKRFVEIRKAREKHDT